MSKDFKYIMTDPVATTDGHLTTCWIAKVDFLEPTDDRFGKKVGGGTAPKKREDQLNPGLQHPGWTLDSPSEKREALLFDAGVQHPPAPSFRKRGNKVRPDW